MNRFEQSLPIKLLKSQNDTVVAIVLVAIVRIPFVRIPFVVKLIV